jgi:hypothetical protein
VLSTFILVALSLVVQQVEANWLLQCSSCVDQSYYSDETLKGDVSL